VPNHPGRVKQLVVFLVAVLALGSVGCAAKQCAQPAADSTAKVVSAFRRPHVRNRLDRATRSQVDREIGLGIFADRARSRLHREIGLGIFADRASATD
jgi:hypothetical protein